MESTTKEKEACCAESEVNLALLDPARWGWTAGGGIDDLLPPHECARRNSTKTSFLRSKKRKRERNLPPVPPVASLHHNEQSHAAQQSEHRETAPHPLVDSEDERKPAAKKPVVDEAPDKSSISFSALSSDGVLNCSIYHRGHEGKELRDDETGELLCDVEASDTNHGSDGPKLIANVTIEFPLEKDGRYFNDTIQWDLSDKRTRTPMQFAVDVGGEYGLTYSQTLELAGSIEDQLRSFVQDNCTYTPPVSLKCEYPVLVRAPPITSALYGQVTGEPIGGSWRVAKSGSSNSSRTLHRCGSGSFLRPPVADKIVAPELRKTDTDKKSTKKRESFLREDQRCTEEVRKRLLLASKREIKQIWESSGKAMALGKISVKEGQCHHCRKEEVCGVFACGKEGHNYCSVHLQQMFEARGQPVPKPLASPICPVCALFCRCNSCQKILKSLSVEFQQERTLQHVQPEQVEFEELYSRCQKLLALRAEQRKHGRWAKRSRAAERPVVAKVPASEFPREVFQGVDIDPGSDAIYSTIFTKDGSFLAQTDALPLADKVLPGETRENGKVVEDGSVDYCNVCKQVGNLLCCDVCPRAFHRECLPGGDQSIDSGEDTWECPSCRREREVHKEDKIDGSQHYEVIFAAFDNMDRSFTTEDMKSVKTISIVYEMLLILMDYDFGIMFREPVDQKQIPTYSTFVNEPMDLGTIASSIINGKYKERFCTEDNSVEGALLAILKDVELVWHNCFIFNFEGSAVFRMAEVQRRKACSIRRQSFDHYLGESVKRELLEYDRSCSQKRRASTRTGETASQASSSPRGQVRHKIAATSMGLKGRPIAVLDPDSGRIVKMYATMQTVISVFDLFLKLKYPCEWQRSELESQGKMRLFVVKSQTDHRLRLFGYRWLFLDDLENGRVAFMSLQSAKKNSKRSSNQKTQEKSSEPMSAAEEAIEMCTGDRCFVFSSLEEALAYGNLSLDHKTTLLSKLEAVPSDGPFAELAGIRWRKIRLEGESGNSIAKIQDVAIVKRDTVSNRVLVGFRSMEAAYEDWLRTLNASLAVNNGPTSSESFRTLYLNGGERIDGLEWKQITSPDTPLKESAPEKVDETDAHSVPKNGITAVVAQNENLDVAGQPEMFSAENAPEKDTASSSSLRS